MTRKGAKTSIRRVQLADGHTLADLQVLAQATLELEATRWHFAMDWPYPDPKARLAEGHPSLELPLAELELRVGQGFVLEQGARTRVDARVEAIDSSPGPEQPTLVETIDHEQNLVLRALRAELGAMAEVPPPAGLDLAMLASLREHSRALWDLQEQGYGRRPGGPPDPETLGSAMLAVARAWTPLVAHLTDVLDRQRLAYHLSPAYHPPDSLLRALLGYRWPAGAPPEGERVIQGLCAGLREWAGEHIVVVHARSLVRCEEPGLAVDLLRKHGSSPNSTLEQLVSVAEGLSEAGDGDEAAARLQDVAARVWGDREQRERARNLLEGLLDTASLAEQKTLWQAADARREELLAQR